MIRTTSDGSIFYPHRGKPPSACPDGYIRDSGDPFVFHPAIKDCENRTETLVSHGCCGNRIKLYCEILQRRIIKQECMNCEY